MENNPDIHIFIFQRKNEQKKNITESVINNAFRIVLSWMKTEIPIEYLRVAPSLDFSKTRVPLGAYRSVITCKHLWNALCLYLSAFKLPLHDRTS
jgi:hypothetical protein